MATTLRTTRRAALFLGASAAMPRPALAQAYPNRVVSIVTGYAPGGGTDVAARIVAEAMPRHLGADARVIVENRPGSAGTMATEWLTRQPADGHVMMLTEGGAAITAPAVVVGGTRYDPIEDFTHLGFISRPPAVLVVSPALAADTAQATLQRLRDAPRGSLTYASSGFGGTIHIWGEMVSRELGLDAVHVPYRSGGQMVQSIMIGETQFGVSSMASAVPLLREGRIKAVALVSSTRFAAMPDVLTFGELGIAGFEMGSNFMMVGPPRIPDAVATTINGALIATLAEPIVRERLAAAGLPAAEPPNGIADARAEMQRNVARMRAMVAQTGIRVQP